jgi:hypothetical protein
MPAGDKSSIGYTIEEAAKRLRNPPPSRSTMYNLIDDGLLEISGYLGDRPFFTDAALRECAERLRDRQKQQVLEEAAAAESGKPLSTLGRTSRLRRRRQRSFREKVPHTR